MLSQPDFSIYRLAIVKQPTSPLHVELCVLVADANKPTTATTEADESSPYSMFEVELVDVAQPRGFTASSVSEELTPGNIRDEIV